MLNNFIGIDLFSLQKATRLDLEWIVRVQTKHSDALMCALALSIFIPNTPRIAILFTRAVLPCSSVLCGKYKKSMNTFHHLQTSSSLTSAMLAAAVEYPQHTFTWLLTLHLWSPHQQSLICCLSLCNICIYIYICTHTRTVYGSCVCLSLLCVLENVRGHILYI